MVKKAILARFIRFGDHSIDEWIDFMPKVKGLRVKEIGAKGDIQISLDETGWFSPKLWLANYQATVRDKTDDAVRIAITVLPPKEAMDLIQNAIYAAKAENEKHAPKPVQQTRIANSSTTRRDLRDLPEVRRALEQADGINKRR